MVSKVNGDKCKELDPEMIVLGRQILNDVDVGSGISGVKLGLISFIGVSV